MRPVFTVDDTALARIPLGAALAGPDTLAGEGGLLREAVFLASRHVRVPGTAGPVPRRLECTWRGYQIRLRERATPHGTFAGVAAARFSDSASLRLGSQHHARTTPSASWLAALADEIIQDPAGLDRLTLTTSPLQVRRGGRYYIERRGNGPGLPPRPVSIRATDVTTYVVEACRDGAPAREIVAELGRRWPQVPPQLPAHTLTSLIRAGILLHDLLGDDAREDPLAQMLGRLPDRSPRRDALARLRGVLAEADCHPPGAPARLHALTAARDAADQILVHERPLRADTTADATITLPRSLAAEAAEAAGLLWRIGWGSPPLTAWHEAFRERYGCRRWVPLLAATDPVTGLGAAEDSNSISPPAPDPRREAALARMLATTLADGRTEIILDQAAIAELTTADDCPPPRTAEIYVRVLAAGPADLAAGRFSLAVCPGGGSQEAGSTAGRFAALLPGTWQETSADQAAVVAELAVLPRSCEGSALSPPTGFAGHRIPVGLPARPGDLRPEDLLLGSSGRHLIVWSSCLQRPVVPVLYSRLASGLLPPLARFLSLAGQRGARPWHGWSWRTSAPFTPAVRYRRTWLAPARWTLPPALVRAAASPGAWEPALDAWRAGTRPAPPQRVVTDDADRHLPLDLDQQLERELLRRYVQRGMTAVTGPPGEPGAVQAVLPGPRGHHLLEVAISLHRREPPLPVPSPPPGAVRPSGTGLYLPGQDWLALAVSAHPSCQDQILAALHPVVTAVARHCDRWFWLRYHDVAHGTHLRVRFHGQAAALAARVLPALTDWGLDLRRQGLSAGFSIIPYEQETERYGGPDAIAAAEAAFCADSALALDLLVATAHEDQRLLIAGVSAAAIVRCLAGEPDQMRAAVGPRQLDRAGRARALSLRSAARQAGASGGSAELPPGAQAAWERRQHALSSYRAVLPSGWRATCASDLIHLHCNRLVPGADAERIARAIAADLLAVPGQGPNGREASRPSRPGP